MMAVQFYKIYIYDYFHFRLSRMKAQYDVAFSHYFDMEPFFNPASVGKDNKLNINAAYAMDMTDLNIIRRQCMPLLIFHSTL